MKIILFIIILSSNLFSIEFIRNEKLDKHQALVWSEIVNNDHYVLTRKNYNLALKKGVPGLFKINQNGDFQEIEMKYLENDTLKDIYIEASSSVIANSKGEIYFNGDYIYKYSNNQWEKLDIGYSKNTLSRIQSIMIDSKDNLWVTFYTNEKAYLVKYNSSTKVIFEVKNNQFAFTEGDGNKTNMVELSNGLIAIHKLWSVNEENYKNEVNEVNNDLWLINQEGEIVNKLSLELSCSFPYYKDFNMSSPTSLNKALTDIYENSRNEVYFSTKSSRITKIDEGNNLIYYPCCQGLSTYNLNSEQWFIFNKVNRLPDDLMENAPYEMNNPIYSVIELSDGRMMFTGGQGFYIVNKDNNIVEVDNQMLLSNGKMIVIGDDMYSEEMFNIRIGRLFGQNINSGLEEGFSRIQKSDNGDLFFFNPYGIFIVNENNFLVSDVKQEDEMFLIYPNPSVDNIKINGVALNSNYKLLNIFGETVLTGIYTGSINVSNLSTGSYFVQVIIDSELKNLKLIKN